MTAPNITRFLTYLKATLNAVDARLELGGRPPSDERFIFHEAVSARVVVVFDSPPDDPDAVRQKLGAACINFSSTLAEADAELAERIGPHSSGPASEPMRALERELAAVAERAGAVEGAIWDLKSPLVWAQVLAHTEPLPEGTESPASKTEFEAPPPAPSESYFLRPVPETGPKTWLDTLRDLEDESFRGGKGLHSLWVAGSPTLNKLFNGIYVVSLRFDDAPKEPRASGALLHAIPAFGRLVAALPPIEPPPRGRVLRFTRPLRPV